MNGGNEIKEPVLFVVDAAPGANAQNIQQQLYALSDQILIDIQELKRVRITLIVGVTNQETYEKVFQAQLRYATRTIPNLNLGPRQVHEWEEIKPAVVPLQLQGKILRIYLDSGIYLTD